MVLLQKTGERNDETKYVDSIWLCCPVNVLFAFFCAVACFRECKQSVIPISFWWLSLSGGAMLLIYSIYRKDPVFILGQATGVFIYVRNLWFIYGQGKIG